MIELLKNPGINKHANKQIKNKQPPFGPTYSLGPVELKTVEAYIETHLKPEFI